MSPDSAAQDPPIDGASAPAVTGPARFKLEGEILLTGVFMWLLLSAFLVFLFVAEPEQGKAMLVALGTELAFGREAGIPAGLNAGFKPMYMWGVSVVQDFATAFLAYPVFLFVLHKFHDRDIYIMRRLRRIEEKAGENRDYVKRWGPLGIALFMLVPFLVNGPFVALVLGRMTGIYTRHLLAPVVAATIVVAGAWTFAVDFMLKLANSVDDRFGYWATGLAILAVGILGLIDFYREHKAAQE